MHHTHYGGEAIVLLHCAGQRTERTASLSEEGTENPRELKCQVCGVAVAPSEATGCSRCAAPYHTDCYAYNTKCAIFGCGTTTTVPYESLPAAVRAHSLEITESTRPEFSIAPYVEGLQRKFLVRVKDLPKTIGAGLIGSILTMVGFAAFVDNQHHSMLWMGLLFCGVVPGLFSPFLAPSQHRHPVISSLVSGCFFFLFYGLRFGDSRFFWSTLTVAAGIFFSTSLAETLVGKLTPIGQALGRSAPPVRHLASWVFFLGSIMVGAWMHSEPLSQLAYKEIGVLSVLALVAAVPALEMGKGEFERRELGDSAQARLPSQAHGAKR